MKIHYFQRYHAKENVATANTMLLLSRFYSYSADKFFMFLKSEFFDDEFEPEIYFNLQEKSSRSIPDATITQESFKIVVETKTSDWFYEEQLINHLEAFSDERFKLLLTLAPTLMDKEKKDHFNSTLATYNTENNKHIIHKNTTFEQLAEAIGDYIDDKDYEMQNVLNDYIDYCLHDGLIAKSDSWKYLRMQLAGTTFDFNTANNVYYDNADRGFRAHDYLGLYKNKSIRAIGKICARILAVEDNSGTIHYEAEFGDITDERMRLIKDCINDGDSHGYNLHTIKHRYFFVEKFIETDYRKITKRPPMGSRIFDLSQVLSLEEMPTVEQIAELLKDKSWT